MLYDRRELNVNFVFNLSLFQGEIDIRKGMKIPLPSFRGGEGTKGALRGEEGRDISRFDICLLSEERASRKMKVENEGVREG